MWTLTYNGTEKSLADWQISGLTRNRRSQAVSSVSFRIVGDALAGLPFAHRGTIIIRRDRSVTFTGGTVWFQGIVVQQLAAASGTAEQIAVTVADAWWHLENLVYAQRFNVFTGWGGSPGEDPQFTEAKTTHLTLNQGDTGAVIGTREQLADILDFAADAGAPLQFTQAELPELKIPLREEKDITCAEAVRRQLDYMDAVTWFDYTTSPPTLNIKRRQDCTVVSRAAAGLQGISLRPRYDLQVPFVQLKFEKNYNDSGGTFLQIVEQIYPDPLPTDQFGGLTATIVLSPLNAQTLVQDVVTDTLDATSLDFWKSVKPELKDELLYADLAIFGNASVKDADGNAVTLPRYLVDGAIADWMDVDAEPVEVSVDVSYTVKVQLEAPATATVMKSRRQTIKTKVLATNAATNTYRQTTILDSGESATEFAGLAQSIYNDLSTLSWEGSIGLVEAEVSGTIGLGNRVNLTGGPSAWTTMNALVQAVTEDVETGVTQVELGVNSHLSAGQLVELLRINRTRSIFNLSTRNGSSQQARLPANLSRLNTTEAPKIPSEQVVGGEDLASGQPQVKLTTGTSINSAELQLQRLLPTGSIDTGIGRILLELSRCNGQTLRLREVVAGPNCDKYCLVLCSETYASKLFPGETAIGE